MIFTLARRELRALFVSPIAWVVLVLVQVIMGFLFFSNLDFFEQVQGRLPGVPGAPGLTELVVSPSLSSAAVVLLLIVPLLTMRVLSEERRNRTLPLLFSAPVSMTEIVVGKYLGVLAFLGVMIGLLALMPLSLYLGGRLDSGLFAAGLLGLALLAAAFAAAGLFVSSLSRHPAVAAVGGFGVLLFFWIIDWTGAGNGVFGYLSLSNHYAPFLRGVFDTTDFAYFALFIGTFVVLAIRRLDADRLGI